MGKQDIKSSDKTMTPEEFFKTQRFQPTVPTTPTRPTLIEKPKIRRVLDIHIERPKPAPIIEPTMMPLEQKVDLVAKSMVYTIWTMTMLFSAVIILIGILYSWPLNIVIIVIAFGLDILAYWTMRKYMR